MYKMKLKPKQTIYLAIGKNISACEVVGVYAHCTYLRCDNISWTVPAFESRGFYGIGQKQELVGFFFANGGIITQPSLSRYSELKHPTSKQN